MQQSFPLNGTYFQTNEVPPPLPSLSHPPTYLPPSPPPPLQVFADAASSAQPFEVPRMSVWNLPRRFVFFGTSVPSIMRGLRVEEIRAVFWQGKGGGEAH